MTVYGPGETTLGSYRPPRRGGGGGSGPAWSCYYYEAGGGLGDGLGGTYPLVSHPLPDLEDGSYYYLQCTDAAGAVTYGQLVQWNPADPLAGIAAAERAAESAYEQLALADPVLHTSPPETGDLLVGLATFVWADGPWQPATATATITTVAATVTATPRRLRVDFGDGEGPVECSASSEPGAEPGGTCAHVFRHRSTGRPGERYSIAGTVTYEVTWAASDGRTGTLPPVARTGGVAVRVAEAQAVVR